MGLASGERMYPLKPDGADWLLKVPLSRTIALVSSEYAAKHTKIYTATHLMVLPGQQEQRPHLTQLLAQALVAAEPGGKPHTHLVASFGGVDEGGSVVVRLPPALLLSWPHVYALHVRHSCRHA